MIVLLIVGVWVNINMRTLILLATIFLCACSSPSKDQTVFPDIVRGDSSWPHNFPGEQMPLLLNRDLVQEWAVDPGQIFEDTLVLKTPDTIGKRNVWILKFKVTGIINYRIYKPYLDCGNGAFYLDTNCRWVISPDSILTLSFGGGHLLYSKFMISSEYDVDSTYVDRVILIRKKVLYKEESFNEIGSCI